MRQFVAIIAVLLSVIVGSNAYSTTSVLTPHDFQYMSELSGQMKGNRLYHIHLSADILKNCAVGCRDIRLFGSDRSEVPYVIILNESPEEKQESYALIITKYDDQADAVVLTMELPEKHRPISSLALNIPNRDFIKTAIVYGSHDRKSWKKLVEDTIYDFTSQVDLRKTRLRFEKSDYRYYRLHLIDARREGADHPSIRLQYDGLNFSVDKLKNKRLRIQEMVASTTGNARTVVVYDKAVFTDFSAQEDENHNTIITVNADLPADIISFELSNPYYFRNVSVLSSETGKEDSYHLLARGSIYSFPLSGNTEVNKAILSSSPKHRYYKFVIENKNNPPLNVRSITFEWVQRNLFFVALSDTGNYVLYVGNGSVEVPNYDLSKFVRQDNWYEQQYGTLDTSSVSHNAGYQPTISKDKRVRIEKTILTGIVIVLVFGIGYWLYRLTGETLKQGASKD